ncbi:hypothetical protein ACHAQJ_007994 [Trichoderma viride]
MVGFPEYPASIAKSYDSESEEMHESPLSPEQQKQLTSWILSQEEITARTLHGAKTWIKDQFGIDTMGKHYEHYFRAAIEEQACARAQACGGGSINLPGFGRSLGFLPRGKDRFPILAGVLQNRGIWRAHTLVIREVCMLKLIEELTNKPEWWVKVRNPEIVDKWKKEALAIDWSAYKEHGDFSPEMVDACIEELRIKADLYEQTGLVPVMDYSACVIKSDVVMTQGLSDDLKGAVARLEDIPDELKDWHPGSDGKVLDLVHPSLWPLVYGRSRILTDRRIGLQESLEYCGVGQVIPVPPESETHAINNFNVRQPVALSTRFQWLPCDVSVSKSGNATIQSYINNLHPTLHEGLYPIIEKFIERSLPAWDIVYRWPKEFSTYRLYCFETQETVLRCQVPEICKLGYHCSEFNRPLNADEMPRAATERQDPSYWDSERHRLDSQWFNQTHSNHTQGAPPPEARSIARCLKLQSSHVKTSGFFNDASNIQVIVKLANIHLTPDKPNYDGGSWHVEGELNEHICATALYYYDSDNITDCHLDFRTVANNDNIATEVSYEQDHHEPLTHYFAINLDSTIQDIGSVLTRPGRALFFPNLYQHHVSPFRLADPSRPGHRKILALFLVDPAIPIISTSNIPPQQRHWWQREILSSSSRLPPELSEMVAQNIDFPIGEDVARQLRMDLIAERSKSQDTVNTQIGYMDWNFCEH